MDSVQDLPAARPKLWAVLCMGLAVEVFAVIIWLGRGGSPVVGLMPLIVSTAGMLTMRECMEYGAPTGILNPRIQSWAFLFGDAIALPVAFFGASLVWEGAVDLSGWVSSPLWLLSSLAIGVLASVVFRIGDAQRYRRMGAEDRLFSPSKLWHDIVVFAPLSAGLLYLGIPALRYGIPEWSLGAWLVIIGFGGWCILAVLDVLVHKPDPRLQHPSVEKTFFS